MLAVFIQRGKTTAYETGIFYFSPHDNTDSFVPVLHS